MLRRAWIRRSLLGALLVGLPVGCAQLLGLDQLGAESDATSTSAPPTTTGSPPPDSGAGSGGADLDAAVGGGGQAADAGPEDPDGYSHVPAGTFIMGSPLDEPERCGLGCSPDFDSEKQHQVTISRDFWIAQTETTQGEWLALMDFNPSPFVGCGLDCPVDSVSWAETLAYCNRLSLSEGLERCYYRADDLSAPYDMDTLDAAPAWPAGLDCQGYRLPTEAEWEYAARAGTAGPTFLGPASPENLDTIAWYGANSACSYEGVDIPYNYCDPDGANIPPSGPHPVGQKQANAWGLHDTIGNVWELVWDEFGEYYIDPVVDPIGPMAQGKTFRVARGGSWLNGPAECRAAKRDGDDCTCDGDDGRGPHSGFRTARTHP